ncbi:extensin [Iris pallida]|uniref:Extensin n=1 Tax=Iris pallida TaxID=29817 RepID=A0AAX6GPM9_IRIPA|nr:extensin [Iris pallida]
MVRVRPAFRGGTARGDRRGGAGLDVRGASTSRRWRRGASGRTERPGVPEHGGARSPGRPEKSAALGQCTDSEVSGGI